MQTASELPKGIKRGIPTGATGEVALRVYDGGIRRFDYADLTRSGPWLFPRIATRYPHLTERDAASFLATKIAANDSLFLWAPHAVCMFERYSNPLSGKPLVREIFALHDGGGYADLMAMYGIAFDWAKRLGAVEATVSEFSDISTPDLAKRFERKIRKRRHSVMEV